MEEAFQIGRAGRWSGSIRFAPAAPTASTAPVPRRGRFLGSAQREATLLDEIARRRSDNAAAAHQHFGHAVFDGRLDVPQRHYLFSR